MGAVALFIFYLSSYIESIFPLFILVANEQNWPALLYCLINNLLESVSLYSSVGRDIT